MAIKWFSPKEVTGSASFYASNITLNKVATVPFMYAYRALVGIDENNNIVIEPLTKDRVDRGNLDEFAVQKISVTKSYSRISSKQLMDLIFESLKIDLGDEEFKKFDTYRDINKNVLVIKTGEK